MVFTWILVTAALLQADPERPPRPPSPGAEQRAARALRESDEFFGAEEYDRAIAKHEEGARLTAEFDPTTAAHLYDELAYLRSLNEEPALAEGAARRSLELFRAVEGHRACRGSAWLSLARALDAQVRNGEAVRAAREAVDLLRDEGSAPAKLAEALGILAYGLSFRDAERSLELSEEALALARRLDAADLDILMECLVTRAEILDEEGRLEEAIPLYREAARLYRDSDYADEFTLHLTLDSLGLCLLEAGRPSEALAVLEEVVAYERTTPVDDEFLADALYSVSLALAGCGRDAEAEAARAEAEALWPDEPFFPNSRRIDELSERADDAIADGRYADALEPVSDIITLTAAVEGPLGSLTIAGRARYARLLCLTGETSAGIAEQRRLAADLEARYGADDPEVVFHESVVADLLEESLRYHEASTLREELLPRIRDPELFVDTALSLATCLSELGRQVEAERTIADLIDHEVVGRDARRRLAILYALAAALDDQGRFPEALSALERCRELLAPADLVESVAHVRVLTSTGFCLLNIGRAEEALARYHEAAAVVDRIRDPNEAAEARGIVDVGLAMVLRDLDRDEEALAIVEAEVGAALSRPRVGPYARVTALTRRGHAYSAVGCHEQALADHREALALSRRHLGPDSPSTAVAWQNLAAAHHTAGDSEAALSACRRAVRLGRRFPGSMRHFYLRFLSLLSTLLLERREDEEAREILVEAVEVSEKLRESAAGLDELEQLAYFETLKSILPYDYLVIAELRLGNPGGSLEALERSRARGLTDLMARSRIDAARDARELLLLENELEKARRLDELTSEMTRLASEIERSRRSEEVPRRRAGRADRPDGRRSVAALERRYDSVVRQRAAFLRDHVPYGAPDDLVAMTELLEEDSLLLHFFLAAPHSYLYVLRPSGSVKVFRLEITDERVESLVADARSRIEMDGTTRSIGGLRADQSLGERNPLATLYEELFAGEVEEELRGKRLLYVVPDAALHRLPLEALVTSETDEGGAPRYWIDDLPPVVYGPSATMLNRCRLRAREAHDLRVIRELVAVGGVDFGDPDLAPAGTVATRLLRRSLHTLPGSLREVQGIQALFDDRNDVVLLTGAEATEARLFELAAGARHVHLATHSFVEETDEASLSALALASGDSRDPANDGLLTLNDLLTRWRSRLAASRLVVLSACDTQQGVRRNDEGVFALSWGLLYAGASSMIVTHWRVDDESSADLMIELHRRLSEHPERSMIDALNAARRTVRARLPEPWHWAPFVMIGSPR